MWKSQGSGSRACAFVMFHVYVFYWRKHVWECHISKSKDIQINVNLSGEKKNPCRPKYMLFRVALLKRTTFIAGIFAPYYIRLSYASEGHEMLLKKRIFLFIRSILEMDDLICIAQGEVVNSDILCLGEGSM